MPVPVVRIAAAHPPAPVLVIVPSIFGVTEDLRAQMEDLAADGVVIALDPFWRTAPGPLPYDRSQDGVARLRALSPEELDADLAEVIAAARVDPQGDGRVVTLGICFGGGYAVRAAARGLVNGAAAWHGTGLGDATSDPDAIRVPLSLHFGADDALVPLEEVIEVRMAFAARDDVVVALYPRAAHGFSQPGSPNYRAAACEDAMEGVGDLLRRCAAPN
jgi:carboxymethylenebutenolidase